MKLSFYNPRRLASMAVVLVVCGALLGTRIEKAFSLDNAFEQIQKYSDVLNLVSKYYVDKIDMNALNEAAIVGLLNKLDPHSVYMPPRNVKQSDEEFSGKFEGIGVQFVMNHDSILIEQVLPEGPSEKVGLLPGDKIIQINNKSTKGFTEDSVRNNLRGPKGTKVNISIARAGSAELLSFDITRDVIPLVSVTSHFMVDNKTAYIALTRFIATSHDEMVKALVDLRGQGMQRLVLDLRNNPGGYLEQAVEIADEFLGGTKTIVYTKGRVSSFDEVNVSHPGQSYEKLPLVVLVSNGSASASEIFSGSMQDLDRAPIVGENTFGKGLVQRQFQLSDGSAIRLTISRYYTASGRSIQRPYDGAKYVKGIQSEDEEDNFGHLNDVTDNDSSRPKFKTTSGRMIYGGGGITPDFIVKSDTVTRSTINLFAASVFYDYTRDLVSDHGAELHKNYTPDSFVKDYTVSDETLNKIIDKGRAKINSKHDTVTANGVKMAASKPKLDDKEIAIDKVFIKNWIRADLGRQIFGANVSARIRIETDKQFQKAFILVSEAQKMAELFK